MKSLIFPELRAVLTAIAPVTDFEIAGYQQHLDRLTKPIGSLGRLEATAARFLAIRGGQVDLPLRKAVYVFAADHGIVEEGVSAYPQEVTRQMVLNFLSGGAAINVLCRAQQAQLTVVDVGVCADFDASPGLEQQKVRKGSRNMLHEPAMLEEELQQALQVGFHAAESAAAQGVTLLAAGEMGIGNTTAASAMTAALTGHDVSAVTGTGTGLTQDALAYKRAIISACLSRHTSDGDHGSDPDPLWILQSLGGLEIAAMAGMILRAASLRIPVVLDGFIVSAAAAIAVSLEEKTGDYLFAGHCSEEPGHRYLLAFLRLEPLLSLGMRLGEGTGAVLAMPLIESALRLSAEMATFDSAGVAEASL